MWKKPAIRKGKHMEAKQPLNEYDLTGKHRITILTGSLPDMSGLGHIKVIKRKGHFLVGHNEIFGFIPWGRFDIRMAGDGDTFIYRNRRFFDRVWKVAQGVIEGEYKAIMPEGLPEIVGTFRMEKI